MPGPVSGVLFALNPDHLGVTRQSTDIIKQRLTRSMCPVPSTVFFLP